MTVPADAHEASADAVAVVTALRTRTMGEGLALPVMAPFLEGTVRDRALRVAALAGLVCAVLSIAEHEGILDPVDYLQGIGLRFAGPVPPEELA